ncbi:MAG: nucleoside triphosphate pyrophosphohydrolase [Candidatus Aminicenantes bacterium]|nr:nucleoside triphosphate pyrophosphohydrolase [Candidatus Aminicenantes bacterium]
MKKATEAGRLFQQLVAIIDKLRSPEGCPWDRTRSRDDILNYFLEEVFEAVDALKSKNPDSAREELGDVLMEVVFLSKFYEEAGKFSIADVLEEINRKMVERHPHVFRKKGKTTLEAVSDTWQRNKKIEKNRRSILDGLPGSAPALIYAFLLTQRVATHGFDWPEASSALKKVKEEIEELEKSIKQRKKAAVAEELGDVLFSLVNVSRLLGYNPEIILRQANKKFEQRFRNLEKELERQGKKVSDCSIEELDRIWERVKKQNSQKRKKRRKYNK